MLNQPVIHPHSKSPRQSRGLLTPDHLATKSMSQLKSCPQ